MTKYKEILHPAVYVQTASGREKNPCLICNKKVEKGERIVEIYSGAYKNHISYTNRFCFSCFLKVLAFNFPEIFNVENKIKKEIFIEGLKNG